MKNPWGGPCKNCGNYKVKRWKKRISNGSFQVVDICEECGKNARGVGICVPHKFVQDIDALPLLVDYVVEYSEPCVVCGNREGTELHHWAPKHIFGEYAEYYPKDYLCPNHHKFWHEMMGVHKNGECEYCDSLMNITEFVNVEKPSPIRNKHS